MFKQLKLKHYILAIVVIIILSLIIFYGVFSYTTNNPDYKITYGATFSQNFSEHLELDWQAAYLAMLDDLGVKYLRLPAYWKNIEPLPDRYDFTDLDWQISEAQKRDVKIILVLGRRQPRWPECHDPDWLAKWSGQDVRQKLLKNMELVVKRYQNNPAIEMWQVENEPFLDFFGECPKISKSQLQEEIDLVKSLDSRGILLTDSGELSTWYPLSKMGDYFGSTLYRKTYNKYFGYWEYFFIRPAFYRLKAVINGLAPAKTFVAELQAEPWFTNGPLNSTLAEHFKSMNTEQFISNAEFARQTNFSRAYFWGVEWWYWLKIKHNDATIWELAKKYFQK